MFDYLLINDTDYLLIDDTSKLIIDEYSVITLDGIVVSRNTASITLDGHIISIRSQNITLDGSVKDTHEKNITIDGVVLAVQVQNFTVDGVVIAGNEQKTVTITLDGIVKNTRLTSGKLGSDEAHGLYISIDAPHIFPDGYHSLHSAKDIPFIKKNSIDIHEGVEKQITYERTRKHSEQKIKPLSSSVAPIHEEAPDLTRNNKKFQLWGE